MGRAPRIDIEGGWYHVMNRGVDRQTIFFTDDDRRVFERLLGAQATRTELEVHAYCLMGNHFHALVHCPEGGLSTSMHHVGSLYARHLNDRLGRDGPVFRSRFTSKLVGTDRYLLQAVRYIHRNPLDLRPGELLDRWRWSSHGAYVGSRPEPTWLRTAFVLGYFNGDRSRFADFVADEPSDGAANRRNTEPITGDDLMAVAADVSSRPEALACPSRGDLARDLAIVLAGEWSGRDRRELLRSIGFESDSSGRAALARARRRTGADESIGPLLEQARRMVGRAA